MSEPSTADVTPAAALLVDRDPAGIVTLTFNRPQVLEASAGSERPVDGVDPYAVRPLAAQVEQLTRRASGRRSRSEADTRRGRYVRAEPAEGLCTDVAFDATMRAAAIRQAPLAAPATLELKAVDLQRKVRERKTGHLILFLVDASWSMAAADRITAAKGAVLSLLVDAYQRRDQVALAVFRREGTRVVLPFTGSVALARRRLKDLAVGGKTRGTRRAPWPWCRASCPPRDGTPGPWARWPGCGGGCWADARSSRQ